MFTITSIDTKPEHDPYVNISGICSGTYLVISPEDNTVKVEQQYQDNSTPSMQWHGREFVIAIDGHPHPRNMKKWIKDEIYSIQSVFDGYKCVWDGNNHVVRLTTDARHNLEYLEQTAFSRIPNYYEYWTMDDWTQELTLSITAETTDEELAELADEITPADNFIILDENPLQWLTAKRDYERRTA